MISLNFWYQTDGKKNDNPLIIEFSFGYTTKEKNKSNELDIKALEEFSILVRKSNDFYFRLFNQDEFVDLKTSKTKTEFAYNQTQPM